MVKIVRMKEVKGNIVMGKEDFEVLVGEIESLAETLEIMSNENLLRQVKEGEEDINAGRVFEYAVVLHGVTMDENADEGMKEGYKNKGAKGRKWNM